MKKVVFTFGRMNPITNGHGKLVRKVQSVAKANRADPHVYLSHTQDSKKNPLKYKTKLSYAKSAFGNVVKQSNDKTVIDILKSLQKKYSDVVMVVGSDRVNEFKKLLDKYNGKDFKFDSVDVVSSGDRDPDAEGVAGMSASKLRDLAVKNNYKEFKMGLPNLREPKMAAIFKDVRKGMNLEEFEKEIDLISEEELELFVYTLDDKELDEEYLEERKPLTIMQRIKRGRMMKRLAPRFKRLRKIKKFRVAPLQRLQFRAKQAAKKMFRKRLAGKKGEKYASLPTSQKIAIDKMIAKRSAMIDKFAKRMLPVVRKKEMERIRQARKSAAGRKESFDTSYLEYIAELRKTPQDKDVGDKKGTQPAKYHKGLKPSTKAARDSHFKKYGDMPDNDPSAYKPAPGDSKGTTKLSKHTKKYHKMFPEKQDWVDRAFNAVFRMTHPKAYKMALDMYKKMLEKGERNPVRKVAMAIKGIDPRDFQDYLDNLVSKGKLARVLANGYLPEAVTPTPKMDVKVPQVHYNTHAAAHKEEKKYPYQAAITDLDLNTKNRNETIKEYAYGPANPGADDEETHNFWSQKADLWGDSIELVKTMRCNNCNAFDQKPATLKAMADALGPEGPKIVKGSNLGFCEFFEFKCAGERVCDAWVGGGPLKEDTRYAYLNYTLEEARGRRAKASKKGEEEKDTENIIMQLRKSVSLRGLKKVKFDDGKVKQIPAKIAQKALDQFSKIKMNNAKYKFMRSLSKSPQSLMKAVNASYTIPPLDVNPGGPAAMDRARMSYISGNRSSIMPRDNYQLEDALERARAAIKREKDADKIKHDRLLDTARLQKTRTKNRASNPRAPRAEEIEEAKSQKVKDALKKKAEKSGISYGTLSKVFDRGMAAWKTGHRPGTTPHQWAFARVNSYIGKGKGTYHGADKDLRNAYEVGTDASVKAYADVVPGQDYKNIVKQIKTINSNNPFDHVISEAMYQGKTVKLNDPIRTNENPKKKFKVYVKDPSTGNVKVVRFGDPGLSIKRDDPKRRKSFRARHNCDNPGPKDKPRYWSCFQWRSGAKVDN